MDVNGGGVVNPSEFETGLQRARIFGSPLVGYKNVPASGGVEMMMMIYLSDLILDFFSFSWARKCFMTGSGSPISGPGSVRNGFAV